MQLTDVTYKRQLILLVLVVGLTVYVWNEYVVYVVTTAVGTNSHSRISQVENIYGKNESKKKGIFMEMIDINKTALNIFFVESSCSTEKTLAGYADNKKFVLNARQSCAVESTALTNPDRPVFVFHSCPLDDDFLQHSPQFVAQLLSYHNVHVVKLNNSRLFSGSPVQRLFEKRLLENSSYPVEHSSDIIRLVLLWRFGGTYCDLDVVTIKSLNDLRTNWAGSESENLIANGVFNFEPAGAAHGMLEQALEHIDQHYDKVNWASNGPLLVTPFILKLCRVSSVLQAVLLCRGDFRVFARQILFPIHYSSVKDLFDPAMGPQILEKVTKESYSVHFYNKMSHEMNVNLNSSQAYVLLAQEFCPLVFKNCSTIF